MHLYKTGLVLVSLVILTTAGGKCAVSEQVSAPKVKEQIVQASTEVLERTVGDRMNRVNIDVVSGVDGKDRFEVHAVNGTLHISGSSVSAICYAFNRYLHEACNSMVTWSGKHLELTERWPDYAIAETTSPYPYRYYLNVVTFGYTTPYWDWTRWEKELDWMALHGINMPLATVASEAIAERVWLKLGLSKEEARSFFTAPAHLPWHRMGNLNKWDGPFSDAWQSGQVELQHKIIDRMKVLGFHPIAPAFAGFVPEAFMKKHPELNVKRLKWGGFPEAYNAFVLPPDSPYFEEIGKMFVQEWEKEFGENQFYLSDSFNEMEVPAPKDDLQAKKDILASYGASIYQSIVAGNPDAIWVTQGWTFGYQHTFWDRESLQALLSRVPDDKMILVDLANDYPKWVWHTDLTWKVHEGFYGKQWIFSYVPNFGGKNPMTGELAQYASLSAEALASPFGKNLVGFGSAPEGIENNEVVYELLADMGWTSGKLDMDNWIENYCKARYGAFPTAMAQAWELFRKTAYGSLYSYPRYLWQTVVPDKRRKSIVDTSLDFRKAVRLFLSCSDQLGGSELYRNDAIEFSAFYLSAVAEDYYKKALQADSTNQVSVCRNALEKTINLLLDIDRLLASHPSYCLQTWIDYARNQGTTPAEKSLYETNAKRLITTWGGAQSDYAARVWSGLIKDYYVPRIRIHFSDRREERPSWEERWIRETWNSDTRPFDNPLKVAKKLVDLNTMPQN
jgi:alpha-N-acetylglucosaminidase